MDVVASLYGRNSLLASCRGRAREIHPFTVGGGSAPSTTSDGAPRGRGQGVAEHGGDRAARLYPRSLAAFGASTIVVFDRGDKRPDAYEAYTDNGREKTGVDALEWAVRVASSRVARSSIPSIDREGTARASTSRSRRRREAVPIPVMPVAAPTAAHVLDVVQTARRTPCAWPRCSTTTCSVM